MKVKSKKKIIFIIIVCIILLAKSITTKAINVDMSINLEIIENGENISEEQILTNITSNFKIGQKYTEEISVMNTKGIDAYIRLVIRKYWVDENDSKDESLDPTLIEFDFVDTDSWIITDYVSSGEQRIIAYYRYPLYVGETAEPLIESFSVNSDIQNAYDMINNNGNITIENKYSNRSFVINVEAGGVQTHYAEKAMDQHWGINATISSDGVITDITEITQ